MSANMITCPQCGSQAPAFTHFCPECGYNLASSATEVAPASPETAAPSNGNPTVNVSGVESPAGYTAPSTGPFDQGAARAPESQAPASQPLGPGPQPSAYTPPPGYSGQPTQAVPQYTPPPSYNQAPGSQPQYQPPTFPGSYSQQPVSYTGAPGAVVAGPPKDPTVALLLELIGYLGFLGIGHIYAGKVGRGIALMIGGWVYLTLSGLLTVVLIGCIMLPLWLVVPIASGLWVKSELEKERAMTVQQF